MPVKTIYITHQKGMERLAPYIIQAIQEVMASFPKAKRYDELFPIVNLGDWKSNNYLSVENGQIIYEPYESIQWYIERAKLKAIKDRRWYEQGQISIDQLYQDLYDDPFAKKIPQFSLLVTSYDLYGKGPDGNLLNFCNGVTNEGHFAIISTNRLMNNDGSLNIDRFQTIVMHEFGHLIGLTPEGRKNTYEQLGTHCSNGDIMAQDMSGTSIIMTQNRLRRKRMGLPPICSDCIEAGCRFLDNEIYQYMIRHNNTLHR